MACTKTGSKNDLFLNCRRKPKELSKKELSNVAPASTESTIMFNEQDLQYDAVDYINRDHNKRPLTAFVSSFGKQVG